MQFPWATVGAKVVYIGPEIIHMAKAPYGMIYIRSPFQQGVIYTIAKVDVLPLPQLGMGDVVCLSFVDTYTPPAAADMFKPVSQKDSELFNSLLTDLPQELIVEDLSERIKENMGP